MNTHIGETLTYFLCILDGIFSLFSFWQCLSYGKNRVMVICSHCKNSLQRFNSLKNVLSYYICSLPIKATYFCQYISKCIFSKEDISYCRKLLPRKVFLSSYCLFPDYTFINHPSTATSLCSKHSRFLLVKQLFLSSAIFA